MEQRSGGEESGERDFSILEGYRSRLESSRLICVSSKVVEQSILGSSAEDANEGEETTDEGDAGKKSLNGDESVVFAEVEKELSSFDEP